MLAEDAVYIGLVKPQFECGREALSKNGIVKDPKQHTAALRKVLTALDAAGLGAVGAMKSPLRGGDGNTEFLVCAKAGSLRRVSEKEITEAVHE